MDTLKTPGLTGRLKTLLAKFYRLQPPSLPGIYLAIRGAGLAVVDGGGGHIQANDVTANTFYTSLPAPTGGFHGALVGDLHTSSISGAPLIDQAYVSGDLIVYDHLAGQYLKCSHSYGYYQYTSFAADSTTGNVTISPVSGLGDFVVDNSNVDLPNLPGAQQNTTGRIWVDAAAGHVIKWSPGS